MQFTRVPLNFCQSTGYEVYYFSIAYFQFRFLYESDMTQNEGNCQKSLFNTIKGLVTKGTVVNHDA